MFLLTLNFNKLIIKRDNPSKSAFCVQKTTQNPKMDDDCSNSISPGLKIIEIADPEHIVQFNKIFIGN